MGHAVGVILIDNRASASSRCSASTACATPCAALSCPAASTAAAASCAPLCDRVCAVQRQQIVKLRCRRIGRFQFGGHRHASASYDWAVISAPFVSATSASFQAAKRSCMPVFIPVLSTDWVCAVAGQKDAVDAVVRRHAAVNRVTRSSTAVRLTRAARRAADRAGTESFQRRAHAGIKGHQAIKRCLRQIGTNGPVPDTKPIT